MNPIDAVVVLVALMVIVCAVLAIAGYVSDRIEKWDKE